MGIRNRILTDARPVLARIEKSASMYPESLCLWARRIFSDGYPESMCFLTGAPLLPKEANIFGRAPGLYVFIDRRTTFGERGQYLRMVSRI